MLKCLQKQNIMGNNRRCAETLQSYSLPPKTDHRAVMEDITFMYINKARKQKVYLMIAVIVRVPWEGESWSKEEFSLQHFWLNKFFQISFAKPPVPVICNVTSVHNLTKEVAQIIIRDLKNEPGGHEEVQTARAPPAMLSSRRLQN